jgi:hypothetical protein
MKKQILSLAMLLTVAFSMAQVSNCDKIKQLISKANKKQMDLEMSGTKFQTADDFEAAIANTSLDGASKCYVQDAQVAKMYVAEFGTSDSKTLDPKLEAKANQLSVMLKGCIGPGFSIIENKPSQYVLKGMELDGRGENINTKVTLMIIYNPADKKQLLFLSIINDPN